MFSLAVMLGLSVKYIVKSSGIEVVPNEREGKYTQLEAVGNCASYFAP